MPSRQICPTCHRPLPAFCKRPCLHCGKLFLPTSDCNKCCSRECQREIKGNFIVRFWSRVNKNGPIAPGMRTPCWLWTGTLGHNGYARIRRQDSRERVLVHRAAWELTKGKIPTGMQVLHKCDIRNCVRHLFLGTQSDNMIDMFKKGRATRVHGSAHGRSKLTESQVNEILRLRKAKMTLVDIAEKFDVSNMQISRICSGKRWSHLQG